MLRKRTRLFSEKFIREQGHKMMRQFHAPQRDHQPKVQHPKPEKAQ
jgi:hypothetical protein